MLSQEDGFLIVWAFLTRERRTNQSKNRRQKKGTAAVQPTILTLINTPANGAADEIGQWIPV
jgi:hypothetical protein